MAESAREEAPRSFREDYSDLLEPIEAANLPSPCETCGLGNVVSYDPVRVLAALTLFPGWPLVLVLGLPFVRWHARQRCLRCRRAWCERKKVEVVADHRGNLVLTSDGTRQQVEELSGSYQLKLENGDLTARRWSAKGDATLTGVTLDLEAFDGALQLHGVASTFAIRQVTGGRIQIKGNDLLATFEGIEAPLAALFEGGSLRVDGYRGEARVAGNGTAFDLAGCDGQWTLTLQNGSDAVVRDFAGLLRAEVVDSTLDAEGVEALALKASGGRIGAHRLGQLNRVEATDVELELDLTGVSAVGAMTLAGATRSRVTLSAPCVVRTVGGQGLPGEAAEVTGCDLEVPDRAPTRLHARRRYGGQATVLNVEVGEGVELSVEGR